MNQSAAVQAMALRHQQALSPQATNQCRHVIHKVKNLTAVDLLDKFCFSLIVYFFRYPGPGFEKPIFPGYNNQNTCFGIQIFNIGLSLRLSCVRITRTGRTAGEFRRYSDLFTDDQNCNHLSIDYVDGLPIKMDYLKQD